MVQQRRSITRASLSPLSTMSVCHVFLLHEYTLGSYTSIRSYQVEVPDEEPVKYLEQSARPHIESHSSSRGLKSFEVAAPKIYLVRWSCGVQVAQNLISGFAVFGAAPGAVATKEAARGD
jgi:hypothetical protein